MSQEHLLTILDNKKPEVIIGCFPPSRKYGNDNNFTVLWSKLVKISQSIGVKHIIMVSSTGVYPIREGVVFESDASLTSIVNNSDSFSDRAKMLLMTEQKVIESGLSFAIVRFGGLVGPNRHPGKFITSSKNKQFSAS
jgi:nucleoside-diphosphate-sugar epimerase